ncbi:MAG: homoserine dehydrogenase [Dehalococcoidales bacterium]
MTKQSIGIGLLGLGTIAGQVAKVLLEKTDLLAEQVGCPVILRKIKVLPAHLEKDLARRLPPELLTTDEDEFFADPSIDIVVEAIGGENPALEYLQRAMSSGKHVVTSNKEVIAKHGAALKTLARRYGVGLRYEGSVGGGIPLIAPFKYDLVANEIKGIFAIINGTTNYILTRMSREGIDFPAALKSAQELGYAEADPVNDIEGIDANYKLAILSSLAFQTDVRPEDIHREGISRISRRDFQYARELGYAIKLLAIAKQIDDAIEVRVHPALIPEDSFLAKVDGVYNAVLVEGDLAGKVLFFGEGAGALATSSAVIADVISSARDVVLGISDRATVKLDSGKKIIPMADIETQYYLRINVADHPGVLARISTVFGDHLISISSVLQKEVDEEAQTAEVVIMTHPAREKAMQQTLQKLGKLDVVKEISNFIRVETD